MSEVSVYRTPRVRMGRHRTKNAKKWLHISRGYGKIGEKRKGVVPVRTVPEKETLDAIAELFKGFADTTRVHILSLLAVEELCVTEIADKVSLSQSAISHQLRILKQMQLIKFRREGKNILYSLADDHVKTILQMGLEHVLE